MPNSMPWVYRGAQSSGRNRKTNTQENNTGVMKMLLINSISNALGVNIYSMPTMCLARSMYLV